jgi:putative acetyltransferase
MRIADYASVLSLWKETEGVGLNESDSRAGIGRYLRRNPGMSVVAIHRGAIVAALLCGHDGRRGYLHHLAVKRKWRGRGIARAMVSRCMAMLRDAHIDKCNLFLLADNEVGHAFWNAIGWRVRKDLLLVQRPTKASVRFEQGSC